MTNSQVDIGSHSQNFIEALDDSGCVNDRVFLAPVVQPACVELRVHLQEKNWPQFHFSRTHFLHVRIEAHNSLSLPDAERLIHVFITSRLHYFNALYSSLPNKKLQYIHNSAGRVLTCTTAGQHIFPVLYKLHWLSIKARIDIKTLILTYKAVNGTVSACISLLFSRHLYSISLSPLLYSSVAFF